MAPLVAENEMTEWHPILREHHEAARSWALHCAGGEVSVAEDGLQSAYEAVLDGTARFDGRSSAKSFLFGVIRNKVRSQRRGRLWRRVLGLEVVGGDAGLSQEPSQGRRVERDARRQMLKAAREKLSPKQREVVELVFYHDLTIEEAAEAMSIGVGTARTHYARAKERLREELEAGETEWIAETTSA